MTDYMQLLYIAIEAAVEAGKRTVKYYNGDLKVVLKADDSPLTLADLESNRIILDFLNPTAVPVLSEESKEIPYSARKNWNPLWLVDPLDGTKEFIQKSAEYSINIALIENHRPVLGVVYIPVYGWLYFALEGVGSYRADIKGQFSVSKILHQAEKLTVSRIPEKVRVVASKSHMNEATTRFIKILQDRLPLGGIRSFGSSLKICMVAEGKADIYPRLGTTMEWDTAASDAVVSYAGYSIRDIVKGKTLNYNKENLRNPHFIVYHPKLEPIVRGINV